MRKDDQIDRRQVGYLASRLDFTPRPDAVAEIDMGALVHERRIGQDGKATEGYQCSGVTDKVNLPAIEISLAFSGIRSAVIAHPHARPCPARPLRRYCATVRRTRA
jgi:hypothetical protein